MADKKIFSLEVLISSISGRLVCEFGEMHEMLETLAGEPVWTHQLPRVSNETTPWLLKWFPELKCCVVSNMLDRFIAIDPENPEEGCRMGVAELRTVYPELKDTYEVGAIPKEAHKSINPITEMEQIRGTDKGIIFVDNSKKHKTDIATETDQDRA